MTKAQPQPTPTPRGPQGEAYVEELDPANQSLADSLRKSFRVLKLLMLVLLVLYFLSGAFSVEQGEVGLILRFGRIVGTAEGEQTKAAVLTPDWYWSWPYPFERAVTVPTSERQLPVSFMFQLSDKEKTSGIKGYRYSGSLSPVRDDYLITGDVNILHASLWVKYRITDAVAYVTNVFPMPDPEADIRSEAYKRYPEYTVLTNLVRDAAIETAASREALRIRGEEQDAFLRAVARRVKGKLDELAAAGAPLGIAVDVNTGIIAPKTSEVEAIMPPRQTQEVFDKVLAAQAKKSAEIMKAQTERQALLVKTAGPAHALLAEAIGKEFELMLELSAAESAAESGDGAGEDGPLRQALARQRDETERLLTSVATGAVRTVLQDAVNARNNVIQEARADHENFIKELPEYLRNPGIFLSRRLDETYARALDSKDVAKLYVPSDCKEYRLQIPRSDKVVLDSEEEEGKSGGVGSRSGGPRFR